MKYPSLACQLVKILLPLSYAVWPTIGHATTVDFNVVTLGGGSYEYEYTILNDTLGLDIDEFTIFFEVGAYEELRVVSTAPDWDPLVIQPDPGIPDDGFFDALSLVSGVSPGESLGAFSVGFDYVGDGVPGPQYFEVVDPDTFEVLDSGLTEAFVVPVPATLLLFGSALLSVIGFFFPMKRVIRSHS